MSLLAALLATLALTGCNDWEPGPPPYNNNFYDRALNGAWELVQINSTPVNPGEANFLDFYGNGRGSYYYYRNGALYRERMSYWCQYSYGSGASDYLINIAYGPDAPTTMSYWWTDGGNRLWMQWMADRGPVTYIYAPVRSVPY